MAVTPKEAGPQWPGWDDVIETRWKMCEGREGDEAFIDYLDELIKLRKWEPNSAHAIAIRLRRGGKDPLKAFPLGDVITTLNGCPGSRVPSSHKGTKLTSTQIGSGLRKAGVIIVIPTRHLDGTYSASAVGGNPYATGVAKAFAAVRGAGDVLENLPPAEILEALTPDMRKQLIAFGSSVASPVNNVLKLLKEGD